MLLSSCQVKITNTVAAVTSPPRSERHSPRYLHILTVEQLNLSVEICTHYLGYPTAAAKCRGVCWKLSSSLTSAPWSTNKVTIALWPRLKYNMYWCRIYIKFFFFNVYFTQNWIRYSFFSISIPKAYNIALYPTVEIDLDNLYNRVFFVQVIFWQKNQHSTM